MEAQKLIFREQVTDAKTTNYLTHGFFNYPARFIPQIPRYFIREYMNNHRNLLDNFCGCGTSLVEAKIFGYDSFGIELNPLGRLLTEVKTTPLEVHVLEEGKERLDELLEKRSLEPFVPNFSTLDFWFDKNAQEQLGRLRSAIDKIRNEQVQKFFLICLANIVRKCSNADPRMIKPVFTKRMREKVAQGRKIDAYKLFKEKYVDFSQRIIALSSSLAYNNAKASVIGTDARQINLEDRTVRLCVTSPAFINAQDYFRETKLEIFWLGLANQEELKNLTRQQIGMDVSQINNAESKKLRVLNTSYSQAIDDAIEAVYEKDRKRGYIMYQYFAAIEGAFKEVRRVLQDDGYFAITIGDSTIRGIPIKTHELIADVIQNVGFKIKQMNFDIIKTHLLVPKRNKTAGLMEKEWAMVFTKK
jgi:hypothetical protein